MNLITIFELLVEQLNSSVLLLIVILVIFFRMLFMAGKWTERFTNQDKRLDKVEIAGEKTLDLKAKVDLIYDWTNPNATTRAQSPTSLTEIGEEIAEKLDAEEILKSHWSELIKLINEKNLENAYDIQKHSFSIAKNTMIDFLNEKQLSKVKTEAFDRGILIEDVMSIFGVYIRNKILEGKGIPISHVDRDEPKAQD